MTTATQTKGTAIIQRLHFPFLSVFRLLSAQQWTDLSEHLQTPQTGRLLVLEGEKILSCFKRTASVSSLAEFTSLWLWSDLGVTPGLKAPVPPCAAV